MKDIDQIACFAMMGLISHHGLHHGHELIASNAYKYAKEMIKQKNAVEKDTVEVNHEKQLREGGKG